MTKLDTLLERNRDFARTDARAKVPDIPFVPNRQLYVITCIDPRVDPAATLGLELGDAIVARNVGGRVTPSLLQDLAWISYLHEIKAPDAEWFEIAVIHHTDCGSALLADQGLRHGFAARGFDEDELSQLPVVNPYETVPADVARLLDYAPLSPHVRVSGHVYDLATGLLSSLAPPRARAEN